MIDLGETLCLDDVEEQQDALQNMFTYDTLVSMAVVTRTVGEMYHPILLETQERYHD